MFFCYAFAFFIPLYDEIAGVITHIWFLLFFGGMLLPLLNGLILSEVSSINPAHLPHSQSLCWVFYNLLGWLPAPTIYGMICHFYVGNKSRSGMFFLSHSTVIGVFLIFALVCKNNKWFGKKTTDNKENLLSDNKDKKEV